MPVRISKNRVALENVPLNLSSEVDVVSAATCNIGAATSNNVRITGTTTITAFDNVSSGVIRFMRFSGALTLTHNATSLILPGGANITTAAGDSCFTVSLGSGNWIVHFYQKASGLAVVASSNKNIIIGGDFTTNPWQRGTSFTGLASGSYGPDRLIVAHSSDAVVDILKTADAPTASEAGIYSAHCLHADVTTADAAIAAGQQYLIRQYIEGLNIARAGFGQAGTRYVTLTFWVKSTKTGIFCVSFINSVQNRSYVAEYTVSTTDTWEKKTVTIAVDTSGTWLYDTEIGLRISWALACGSTFQTSAGAWAAGEFFATSNQVNALDSTSNNFKLALIQLEMGQVASTMEYRSAGEERALCERYYESGSFGLNAYVNSTSSSYMSGAIRFATTKRSSPTITQTNGGATGVSSTPGAQNISVNGFESYRAATSNGAGSFSETFTAASEL